MAKKRGYFTDLFIESRQYIPSDVPCGRCSCISDEHEPLAFYMTYEGNQFSREEIAKMKSESKKRIEEKGDCRGCDDCEGWISSLPKRWPEREDQNA